MRLQGRIALNILKVQRFIRGAGVFLVKRDCAFKEKKNLAKCSSKINISLQ